MSRAWLAAIPILLSAADDASRDILTLLPPPADRRIAYGDDPNQFGDLRLPEGKGPHPVVVVIHGGYWRAAYDLRYAGHMAAALTKRGFATWNIEYRRIGQAGGGYPGTFDDVAAAAAFAAQLPGVDSRRVIALGHSAGGHLALWLAMQGKVSAAVSLAGIPDLADGLARELSNGAVRELMICAPVECPDRYRAASPIEMLPLKAPVLCAHGEDDRIVPPAMSRAFVAAAGKQARLMRLPRTGHFEIVDPRTWQWKRVEEAVLRLLR